MILGIYLSSGDSFSGMAKSGQDIRFKEFYLKTYAKKFSKVYVFSYLNEQVKNLPKNVELIPNKYNLNRYLYGLILPFINHKYVSQCNILRVFHLTGTVPAIITKFFFNKPFIYNYAFNYQQTCITEGKWFQSFLILMLNPLGNFFTSKIIVASTSVLKFASKSKVILIPNGVDINLFRPIKKKLNETPLILSIGRLNVVKNYENLVVSLKGLRVTFLLIGQGELKPKLKKLAKKNKIKLTFVDKVDNLNLPAIYNKADIFVLPSFSEGSPKVLLEAMACGVPVIGSQVDGIKEIIIDRQNGLFCQLSSQSIREKIKVLINNPKLGQKISRQARLYIEKNFELDKLLAKEIKILRKYAI